MWSMLLCLNDMRAYSSAVLAYMQVWRVFLGLHLFYNPHSLMHPALWVTELPNSLVFLQAVLLHDRLLCCSLLVTDLISPSPSGAGWIGGCFQFRLVSRGWISCWIQCSVHCQHYTPTCTVKKCTVANLKNAGETQYGPALYDFSTLSETSCDSFMFKK